MSVMLSRVWGSWGLWVFVVFIFWFPWSEQRGNFRILQVRGFVGLQSSGGMVGLWRKVFCSVLNF